MATIKPAQGVLTTASLYGTAALKTEMHCLECTNLKRPEPRFSLIVLEEEDPLAWAPMNAPLPCCAGNRPALQRVKTQQYTPKGHISAVQMNVEDDSLSRGMPWLLPSTSFLLKSSPSPSPSMSDLKHHMNPLRKKNTR